MGLEFNRKKTGSAYISTGSDIDKTVSSVLPKGDVAVGLLKLDAGSGFNTSREVSDALNKLAGAQPELSLSNLDSERKWIIQLYSADLFGGLNIANKGLLPLGVMTMLRNKKVTWQMVL